MLYEVITSFIINTIFDSIYSLQFKRIEVPYDFERTVSSILNLFLCFTDQYFKNGVIPQLSDSNDIALFSYNFV